LINERLIFSFPPPSEVALQKLTASLRAGVRSRLAVGLTFAALAAVLACSGVAGMALQSLKMAVAMGGVAAGTVAVWSGVNVVGRLVIDALLRATPSAAGTPAGEDVGVPAAPRTTIRRRH